MLVIDDHPLLPTDAGVRAALDTLGRAARQGRRQGRARKPAAARSRRVGAALHAAAAVVPVGASCPPEIYRRRKARPPRSTPDDTSLGAERMRGVGAQPSRLADRPTAARTRLRAQWRELFERFDVVLCPPMPTPAFPHDHSPDQEARRIDIDGKHYPYPRSAGLAGDRDPARPAGDGGADRPVGRRPADRRADHRPLSGGPHAAASPS